MRVRIDIGADSLLNEDVMYKRVKAAQWYLDNEIMKDCDPYVPFRTGTLAGSAIRNTDIGEGKITYRTPYAEKVYNSHGWHFNKSHHKLATDHWAVPVLANNREKYKEGVKKRLLGGKK